MRKLHNLLSAIPLCLLLIQCGEHAADRGFARSIEDLGRTVVDALNSGKEADLHKLRVSETGYTEIFYPGFEASKYRSGFPVEFAWENLDKKCIRGVSKWAYRHGKQDLEFVGIRFEKPTESFQGFRLHRGTVLTVRTPEGKEIDLRILGSVVQRDDRYKLLSYDD